MRASAVLHAPMKQRISLRLRSGTRKLASISRQMSLMISPRDDDLDAREAQGLAVALMRPRGEAAGGHAADIDHVRFGPAPRDAFVAVEDRAHDPDIGRVAGPGRVRVIADPGVAGVNLGLVDDLQQVADRRRAGPRWIVVPAFASSSPCVSVTTVEKSLASTRTGSPEVRNIVRPISSATEKILREKTSIAPDRGGSVPSGGATVVAVGVAVAVMSRHGRHPQRAAAAATSPPAAVASAATSRSR